MSDPHQAQSEAPPVAAGPTDPARAAGGAGGPGPANVPAEQRPHPLTPLIRGWIVLLAILFYVGREFIPDGNGSIELPPVQWILLAIAGIVLLAGLGSFVTWWNTRYVIDAGELRIETGLFSKSSRKIGFNRIQSVDLIQPLGARLFSLAELRIEAGSGGGIKIRYLKRSDATRLRDYLLARAHGTATADVDRASDATAFADRSATDTVITTIGPGQLIGGLLLSHELIVGLATTAVVLGIGLGLEVVVFTLPLLLPMAFGTISLIARRVLNQFNFVLADSGQGVRVTRGLTNLTSQSLPVDRIQGVRIRQPLLWRITGWYRVDVDVLGYSGSDSDGNNRQEASSLLLPVATAEQVRLALAAVLPGTDHRTVELHPIPRAARWLRWWNAATIRYGADDRLAVMTIGWLTNRRDLVPHAKTQSVRIAQGPIQRRLGLATWQIHSTPGPVKWETPSMDQTEARRWALEQLDRARVARATPPHTPPPVADELPSAGPWPGGTGPGGPVDDPVQAAVDPASGAALGPHQPQHQRGV